jgi:hypothetical protein
VHDDADAVHLRALRRNGGRDCGNVERRLDIGLPRA